MFHTRVPYDSKRRLVLTVSSVAVAAATLGVALGLGTFGARHPEAVAVGRNIQENRVSTGTELISVLIVTSSCSASRYPGLVDATRAIDAQLAIYARETGRRLVRVGVNLDANADEGLRFLGQFGGFDEVISGGNWLSTGSIHYLLRELPASLAVPQLVLLERDVTAEGSNVRVSEDRLITRKTGYDEILAFAASEFSQRY